MIPFTADPSPVSMSSGVKASSYTIALTGKTFDVLSSMLYKDPHLAIIRELSCNAYDSHVESGCLDKAFDIHLPNLLEPFFSIRDYGTGMSAEQINSVYTKFFESTKTTSNDVVGALGLGSKSPFSYTSNYTITSWHGGMKLVYSAFKSTDGIPSIALLDISDSNEPNGLEVNFAVKAADFEKFTSKVQSFFTTWGSTPPNISGGLQGRTTLRQVQRDFGGTDWFVAKSDGPLTTALAIQGNVPYPLQRNTVTGSNAFREKFNDKQRTLLTRLLELPIIITFPIGSLDFSASREELQYTEQTVAVILDKLIAIGDGIKAHIEKQFADLPTMWDVVKFCRMLRNDRLRHIVQYVASGNLTWKGQLIHIETNSVKVDVQKAEAALAIHPLQVQINSRRKMDVFPLTVSKFVDDKPVTVINQGMAFHPKDETITVIVFDETKGCASKVKYHYLDHIRNTLHGNVITIGVPRGEKLANVPLFKKAVDTLLEAFKIPGSHVEVVYASQLTAAPSKTNRASQAGKPDDTFKVFTPSVRSEKCPDRYAMNCWSAINEADLDTMVKGGKYKHIVFVPQVRGVPQVMRVGTVDTAFRELGDDFPALWNDFVAVYNSDKILLIGIKTSALDTKKAKTFIQQHQSFDAFMRFWMYANAKTLAETDAYHVEWVNQYGRQNIVLRAIATMTGATKPSIISLNALLSKFVCDNTAQQRAAVHNAAINRVTRVLRECDRWVGKDDTALAEIASVVTNAGDKARSDFVVLQEQCKQVIKEFPMLEYVNQHFRYTGNTHEIANACAHIQKYITLASA